MPDRSEPLAKEAFSEFLRQHGVESARWRKGRNPPDFDLHTRDASFAVEVTRVMERLAYGGLILPTHGWRAPLEQLVADIESNAKARGLLAGSYAMRLAPIPRLKQRRHEIMEGAVKFIANTQHCDAHREIVLSRVENGRSITIRKVGSSPTQVGALMVIGLPKFAAQARAGLAALIQERVQEKQRLLKRIHRPRILLLVDSYVYSDNVDWLAALRDTDVGAFHTVARVVDRSCQSPMQHGAKVVFRRLTRRVLLAGPKNCVGSDC